jgi:3',5'-nucleoside bisphosphate phosphatase
VRPAFDLQAHSTCSDGHLVPAEVVARAREAGVELLALTDHDTVDGVDDALETAAELGGIEVVPAVELSAVDGVYEDLHVCGYGIDHRSPALRDALAAWQADRAGRIHRMADALAEIGLPVDLPERAVVGRPHPPRELRERHGIAIQDAFDRFLVPGTPTYRPRTTPTVFEAIEAIHAAGGLAVWAHPFWDLEAEAEVVDAIDRFAAAGLDGVEVFYVEHSEAQVRLLHRVCRERGLLITGSSDFHGPEHERFGGFLRHPTYGLQPDLGSLARS